MPGEKRPFTQPVHTSLFDSGWEQQQDEEEEDDSTTQVETLQMPRKTDNAPDSATEVDALLEELQPEDTLATVRRADQLPGLGGPPEVTASPLGGRAPFRVGPLSEPPGASPESHRPLPAPVPPPDRVPPSAPAGASSLPSNPPAASLPPVEEVPPLAVVAAQLPATSVAASAPAHDASAPAPAASAPSAVPSPASSASASRHEPRRRPSRTSASLKILLVAVLTLLVLAVGVFGFAVGFRFGHASSTLVARAQPRRVSPPPPSARVVSPPPAPVRSAIRPPAPPSLLDRVRSGDPAALKQVEAQSPEARTIDEAVAISAGHLSVRERAIEALGKELRRAPSKLEDHKLDWKLIKLGRDEETGRTTLKMIAELGTARSADLLYRIWTGTPRRTDSTKLAEALLMTAPVRRHASPALTQALNLRIAKTCTQFRRLLPNVTRLGDRRSLYVLAKLYHHRGCGKHKRQDCYRCLRKSSALDRAIKVVRRRDPPKF